MTRPPGTRNVPRPACPSTLSIPRCYPGPRESPGGPQRTKPAQETHPMQAPSSRSLVLCLSLMLLGAWSAGALSGQGAASKLERGTGAREKLLDGKEKSFLIVGYSTSYAWPAMLQGMLDEHAGGKRVYHVLNAVAGGAAVEIWNAEKGTRNYARTIGAAQRDFLAKRPKLRGKAPRPRIALAQQSLQFTRTLRGPIAEKDDAAGIKIGADAMEKLARRLKEMGIERTYWAMHIYKKPIEPEVGNERLALAALLKRRLPFVAGGPDVWEPTRKLHEKCFAKDGVHPNALGMKIMAERWYSFMAGADAKQGIVKKHNARKYDVRAMMAEYQDWRAGKGPAPTIKLKKVQ